MFMSMGEPMLNWDNVEKAIRLLNQLYPNAQLLISTMGINNDIVFKRIIDLSCEIDKIGLQFSVHKSNDYDRDILIPYKNKYTLRQLRDRGAEWARRTGRNVYINYCVDNRNRGAMDAHLLMTLFSPVLFNMTFSVICEADETLKNTGEKNLEYIRDFEQLFIEEGYNTRIFDPAGQDDIGGGCGMLWFVQKHLNEYKK